MTQAVGLDGPMGAGLVIVATGCAATSSPPSPGWWGWMGRWRWWPRCSPPCWCPSPRRRWRWGCWASTSPSPWPG
ncbi:hypothetical protein [Teichococcus aestuarii]|uniref:hypothetical protein n=1 Tax=Teichococcus aestuarii TaxID=568898 RepID=UPI0036135FFA